MIEDRQRCTYISALDFWENDVKLVERKQAGCDAKSLDQNQLALLA